MVKSIVKRTTAQLELLPRCLSTIRDDNDFWSRGFGSSTSDRCRAQFCVSSLIEATLAGGGDICACCRLKHTYNVQHVSFKR